MLVLFEKYQARRLEGEFWNTILMLFYMNVFYLDIEENPGPATIYEIVDACKTVCSDFSQGN